MEVFLFNFPIILVAIAFGAGLGAYATHVSYKKRIADRNIQQDQVTASLIVGMGSELENGLEGLKTQTASLKAATACIRLANQSTVTATERLSALGERGKTMSQSERDEILKKRTEEFKSEYTDFLVGVNGVALRGACHHFAAAYSKGFSHIFENFAKTANKKFDSIIKMNVQCDIKDLNKHIKGGNIATDHIIPGKITSTR
jgi:hypothetical protein